MSKKFDALCYLRIFSDNGEKTIDSIKWKKIVVRGGGGFNYISKYKYCHVNEIVNCVNEIFDEYEKSLENLIENQDESELYIWLEAGGQIEKMNDVSIDVRSLACLAKFEIELCFSADPGFPQSSD